MTTPILRLFAFLITLFTLTVGLIRAQPYLPLDLPALIAASSSDTCAPPCLMNVRPGDTSLENAFYAFDDHPWLQSISADFGFGGYDRGTGMIAMHWRSTVPQWIRTTDNAFLWVDENQSSYFFVPTTLQLAEFWLSHAPPTQIAMEAFITNPSGNARYSALILLVYPGYVAQTRFPCTANDLWQQTVDLWIYEDFTTTLEIPTIDRMLPDFDVVESIHEWRDYCP